MVYARVRGGPMEHRRWGMWLFDDLHSCKDLLPSWGLVLQPFEKGLYNLRP